jgi:DNA-directed RNA polymerase subunit M
LPSWTCPNRKCAYDKQLEPGQHCPLCGEEAQEFSLTEFGKILKEKWELEKSIIKEKRHEEALKRRKFCPRCGSTNINFLVFYRPSIWRCLDCGYEGAFIVEDGKLAEKLKERYDSNKEK